MLVFCQIHSLNVFILVILNYMNLHLYIAEAAQLISMAFIAYCLNISFVLLNE